MKDKHRNHLNESEDLEEPTVSKFSSSNEIQMPNSIECEIAEPSNDGNDNMGLSGEYIIVLPSSNKNTNDNNTINNSNNTNSSSSSINNNSSNNNPTTSSLTKLKRGFKKFIRHFYVRHHPLPPDPNLHQRVVHALRLPPHGPVAELVTRVLIVMTLWIAW